MNTLKFNVIVTCRITKNVLLALEEKDEITGYDKEMIGAFQVMFDVDVDYGSSESREAVMKRVKKQVRTYMLERFGLGERSLKYVSTAANWREWEAETGRIYEEEEAKNREFRNGKFVMSGYQVEVRKLEKEGINLNDLALRVSWEYENAWQKMEETLN